MTVQELISELQKCDLKQMVVVPGYEDGYNNTKAVCPIRLTLDANSEWYYGRHKEDDNGEHLAILIQ